ncbi:arginine deiminase-related protein [Amycolatopsis cynarae]|uniref:Arginine deiminase-related protein n=1 Tax=Amycolatopsis cynarae TaxID=2995223 RepID=A0ABY7AXD7_9PSEU|nr:arginine deiminase-related protein [Amycolatopsis sp. HUAS 11-8]WAL63849.1 arginine deiminase-related protein [Amycolatopsis sp. HUAS 11-8]
MSSSVNAAQTKNPADPVNPSQLECPAFLVNAPFSYRTDVANNAWMQELPDQDRAPERKKAMVQFLELYRYLAGGALVYVLPTPRIEGLQDLVFTANLGIVLEHLDKKDVVVLSNFTSEPRRGETEVGLRFFEQANYRTYVPPAKFEGEAELKHLYDNVYVGGYGLRSEAETYEWMRRRFDMTIVPLELTDPYLYHLDCTVFPLTREETLVCTEMYDRAEVKELERYTDIIDVSPDLCLSGICNSVRLHNTLVNASHVHELKAGTEDYQSEVAKNRRLEDIAASHAFEVTLINLSEYLKGGALLSCMVLHLNRHSYDFRLV